VSVPLSLGNNLDTVRQHNLAAVVGIVHRHGPQSRSELTRTTGLNRSTVGALVSELVDLGLVTEAIPETNTRVGRPSPVVAANPKVVAVAVNPEVDAITVGLVGLDGTLHRRVRHATETPAVPEEAARIVRTLLDGLRAAVPDAMRPVAIGAAIPGMVRERDGVVRLAPHLGWVDAPVATLLADATGLPVRVANDASLGANAEYLYGAGRGVGDLVYLNGGAGGIGGGVIAGGAPLTGVAGYAGELGHTLVNSAGVRCHCGAIGCLETEVNQAELLDLLGLNAPDADELEAALTASTDPAVREVVERQLGYLATALRNATNVFNPRMIVLGGFLGSLRAAAPGVLEPLVGRAALQAPGELVQIARAGLGSRLLMVGAAELAFEELLTDPASFSG
jgi:predicted NBD/HSP70 family sugar kinase